MDDIRLETMEEFFANRLSGYDEHMLKDIEGAEEFYTYTASRLPQHPGAKILDLGCGTGLELEPYFRMAPEAFVTGIDISGEMLEALRMKFPGRRLRLIKGSYFDVALGDCEFEGAVSVESLHHFPEDMKLRLYRKLLYSLKPGAVFVLTDYFAESDEMEKEYFDDLAALKKSQNIPDSTLCHYDTPLTPEHEARILDKAGFRYIRLLKNWGATFTLEALSPG